MYAGVTVCGGGRCQSAGRLSLEALAGLLRFLEAEQGGAERVAPGELRQSGRVHGGGPACGRSWGAMSN